MIASIVLFILKFIFSTASLTIIYILLFKDKASYKQQRIMLILTPILGMMAATTSFEYIPIKGSGGEIIRNMNESIVSIVDSDIEQPNVLNAVYASFLKDTPTLVPTKDSFSLTNSQILTIMYLLVVLGFCISFIISTLKIYKIKKLATRIDINNSLSLYKSGLIKSPFSFLKSIYVDRKTSGKKLFMILEHERSHIDNKHYIDKMIMIILQTLLWFNPIIWYIKNEIEKIHEFESDQNVLQKGNDKIRYQQYIIDELTPAAPIVANGFNNSLIKKRFIMMRENYKVSHKLARKLLTTPLVLALFTITAFTYAKEEVILSNTDKIATSLFAESNSNESSYGDTASAAPPAEPIDTTPLVSDVQDTVIIIRKNSYVDSAKNIASKDNPFVTVNGKDIVIKDSAETITISTPIILDAEKTEAEKTEILNQFKKVIKEIPSKYNVDHSRIDKVNKNLLNVVPIEYNGNKNYLWEVDTKIAYYKIPKENVDPYTGTKEVNGIEVLGVIANKDNTLVDVVVTPPYNAYWISFNSNCSLVDNKTGDKYMIHSIKNGIPTTHPLLIHDMLNTPVVFTLIFPPLKDNVQKVDFIEFHDSDMKSPSNGGNLFKWNNLEVLRGKKTNDYYNTKGEVIRMK